MQASFTRWLGLLCVLLLLCAGLPARADTPVSLFQSFRGNVNFVGTEETIRFKDNKKPCMLVNKGVSASLQGIPSGAVIKSAQLYWAGSGATPDYKVTFDGISITAPVERQYVAKSNANNTGNTYFGGAADVTTQVSKKGNGTYTFSGLSVDNGDPWCAVQGVVGGFALVVVYSHPNEPFRMLNLYEGFQDFQNTSLKISLGDFNVPNPLPANVTGRVGHITWEGDSTLSQGGEDLLFNGYEMTDKLNPKGNQFNSASNVTGDTTSYGIDFDIYTLTSPVIQPGQSTASTTYKSGQDLVILSSEIVAMPYVANADLSLAMTRTGDLTVGSTTNYTLSVANGGVDDETGPVTVVDTLPAGLKLVSAGGTGWTCTSVASATQTVVTCTQPGPIKSGAKMTPLVIAVSPTASGNYTNTATVSGKTGDDKLANNTATNTGSSAAFSTATMVFTKEPCNANDSIVIAEKDTGCHRFIGPVTAADNGSKIYITAIANGPNGLVASAASANDVVRKINLRFTCLPNAGVSITYAGQTFDCQGATWTDLNIKFLGGKPTGVLNDTAGTALAPFFYADVGRVTVAMRVNTTLIDTVSFISKPQYLSLESIYRSERSDDTYADTQGGIGENWAKPDIGFARAGEQFAMRICARMANAGCAPSFGKEEGALGGVLPPDTLTFNFELDLFAVNLKGTPRLPIADKDQVVRDAFLLEQPFKRVTTGLETNMFEAKARYFEAGMLGMTARLVDYLGAGEVTGSNGAAKENGRLVSGTRVAGRFYPDHFVTETTSNFQCLPPMNCPSAAGVAVTGATYSMQPFVFSVRAYGLPRPGSPDPTLLSLYQNLIIDPDKPRPLVLIGAKAPNVSQVAAVGRFDTDPATQLKPPAAADDFPDLGGLATWRLGEPYSSLGRAANTWGAPTPVYLRASMDEFRGIKGGSQKVTVSSLTPTDAAAGTQYEDGLMVIAGRLFVPNVFGSDLLRLPAPLTAQYWSGAAWVASANDNASVVASAIRPAADGCRKFFAQDPKTGSCKANPLTPVAGGMPVTLVAGRGTLILQAPARGTVGSVDYTLDSSAAPWLPSTRARATFGLYRSPVIYLREVY